MFAETLENITERARHFSKLNVIDVSFDDDSVMEMFIAFETSDRVKGLSGLASLDVGGMLFCYPSATNAMFTMEGMLIDLDIAFYDSRGFLLDLGTYKKDYSLPIGPMKPFNYVVEAPAGTLVTANLKVANGS